MKTDNYIKQNKHTHCITGVQGQKNSESPIGGSNNWPEFCIQGR